MMTQKTEMEQDGVVSAISSVIQQMKLGAPQQYIQVMDGRIRINEQRKIEDIYFVQKR